MAGVGAESRLAAVCGGGGGGAGGAGGAPKSPEGVDDGGGDQGHDTYVACSGQVRVTVNAANGQLLRVVADGGGRIVSRSCAMKLWFDGSHKTVLLFPLVYCATVLVYATSSEDLTPVRIVPAVTD